MTHFLLRGRRLGGQVHVGVWAGTELQAMNRARPKLGSLVMDLDQWDDLTNQLDRLAGHGPAIFDVERVSADD